MIRSYFQLSFFSISFIHQETPNNITKPKKLQIKTLKQKELSDSIRKDPLNCIVPAGNIF